MLNEISVGVASCLIAALAMRITRIAEGPRARTRGTVSPSRAQAFDSGRKMERANRNAPALLGTAGAGTRKRGPDAVLSLCTRVGGRLMAAPMPRHGDKAAAVVCIPTPKLR